MSKGSRRRPTQITRDEEEQRWRDAFGDRPLPTVMSEDERLALEAEKQRLIEEGNQ